MYAEAGRVFKPFKFGQYFIQHCFICRSSDSIVSVDAGIATLALAVRRSNHSARSHPHSARSHPHSARSHPCSAGSHLKLDRFHPLISVRITFKLLRPIADLLLILFILCCSFFAKAPDPKVSDMSNISFTFSVVTDSGFLPLPVIERSRHRSFYFFNDNSPAWKTCQDKKRGR